MLAMQKFNRYEALFAQFPFEENQYISTAEYDSLKRIFHFLYENTNIIQLVFIREETLIQYLKYQRSKQFKVITFTQAIQDIKIFILYLRNKRGINRDLKLDISLKNYHFWINL